MERKEFLFDGNAKQLYSTEDPNCVIITYKDDISAYGGIKKSRIQNKGILNNLISEIIYLELEKAGIKTHFIKRLDDRNQLCMKLELFQLEFIVRNIIAGSAAHRLEIEEGLRPDYPIYELCLKNSFLNDPMINDHYAIALNTISREELEKVYALCERVNQVLCELFDKVGIDVVDFKLEFGKDTEGNIILADEISPDTARFWDKDTHNKLDRDRFKRDMGKVEESYRSLHNRLVALFENK